MIFCNLYLNCYRFLIPVQDIIDAQGLSALLQYDKDGHTPMHWAALGGHTHVIRYFVQIKVSFVCAL